MSDVEPVMENDDCVYCGEGMMNDRTVLRTRNAIRHLPIADLTELSLQLERGPCWDSIPTMRSHYPDRDNGPMVCPHPQCKFSRVVHNIRDMYAHAHLSHESSQRFAADFCELLDKAAPDD